MSTTRSASAAGQFAVGGDIRVNRLGYGAMRVTGPGIWGPPADRAAAIALLRRLPSLGIDIIDTADSYGPHVSEELICEALHPYAGLLIATKGGLTRQGPDLWAPLGRPDYLRQCVLASMARLGVERIDLWQLHRVDPGVPRDDQFGVIADMQREGLIRHAGLSNVHVDDIQAAQKHFKVVTVQNRYNLGDRGSEAVLDYCDAEGIGFIPWYPLAAGKLAGPDSALATIAARHGATPGQVALAWLLKRAKVMLPIPGTGDIEHLIQNTAAASLELSEHDFSILQASGA